MDYRRPSVVIDHGPPCPRALGPDDAVVVVDVIRSMTTAVTAAAQGRRVLPVASVAAAHALARGLRDPLLAGELGGRLPAGFELTNSPAAIAARRDLARPLVLLSSSGTPLLAEVAHAGAVYAGCLRNAWALTRHLRRHQRVVLLGALTRGELREEDQLCCARIARWLAASGYLLEDARTQALVERWGGAPTDAMLVSRSVAWLRATGQIEDLDFIRRHEDDIDGVFVLDAAELVRASAATSMHAVG